jgi:hypothetical protein
LDHRKRESAASGKISRMRESTVTVSRSTSPDTLEYTKWRPGLPRKLRRSQTIARVARDRVIQYGKKACCEFRHSGLHGRHDEIGHTAADTNRRRGDARPLRRMPGRGLSTTTVRRWAMHRRALRSVSFHSLGVSRPAAPAGGEKQPQHERQGDQIQQDAFHDSRAHTFITRFCPVLLERI